MTLTKKYFEERDKWVEQQKSNGAVELFDFCQKYKCSVSDLINLGLIEIVPFSTDRLNEIKVTEAGKAYVTSAWDVNFVPKVNCIVLKTLIEESSSNNT